MFESKVFLVSSLSMLIMLVAYWWPRPRIWHVSVMGVCMLYDLCIPFYLYGARNWPHILIDKGEILDYLVWMHVFFDILLFVLYVMQIRAGISLWQGSRESRTPHAQQAKMILAVRILVILTGGMLAP